MSDNLSFSNQSLNQQGYSCSIQELNNISNGLRFTPLLCMGLAIIGLFLQNPYFHFGLAALGILPFWAPKHHPFDLLYNHVIRHFVGGEKLPQNPLQRRIACVMGGLMNIGIGLGFYYNSPLTVYIFAGILIPLQIIVITTHFCMASWMYEGVMKMLGLWNGPLPLETIKKHLTNGALLIDVRSQEEYNQGHIDTAINIPLDIIENDERALNNEVILYCKSGIRCMDAQKRLSSHGNKNIYLLGAMNRWN